MNARWARLTVATCGLLAACRSDRPTAVATPEVLPGVTVAAVTDQWTLGDQVTGAIFTTTPNGGIVNENVRYNAKIEVYLDGGPRNQVKATAAGLKDGLYVFQITDPSGKVLLSEDPSKCRVVRVEGGLIKERVSPADFPAVIGGPRTTTFLLVDNPGQQPDVYAPCHLDGPEGDGVASSNARHDRNTDVDHGADGALVIQMMPFRDTPNPGGVYKAWMTPAQEYLALGGNFETRPLANEQKVKGQTVGYARDPGFGPPLAKVKTDNFKVRENPPLIVIKKYDDVNGDALLAPPDTTIEGWPVIVFEEIEGAFVQTGDYATTTDPIHVPFNTNVKVCEQVMSGWAFAYAYVGATKQGTVTDETIGGDPYKCITFNSGAASTTIDVGFGNFELGAKSGLKFEDLNGDGDRDAGEGVKSGWPIYLINAAGTTVLQTATTLGNGTYSFGGLAMGTYIVCEGLSGDWTQSAPNSSTSVETNESVVSCPTIVGYTFAPKGYQFQITGSGQSFTNNDFGNWLPASLSGYKYSDENANGQVDGSDDGLAGWEIHLFSVSSTGPSVGVHRHATTDADGKFAFANLPPGTYWLCESIKTNWVQTSPTSGVDCSTHAAGGGTPTGQSAGFGYGYEVTLQSGDSKTVGFDFLNRLAEGCTPGFWKQDFHFGFWTAPYTPSTVLSTVFTEFNANQGGYPSSTLTMLQALDLENSTGIGQVLRHGTAALLNAASPNISYLYTPAQVISMVNAALDAYDLGNQQYVDAIHAALALENERGCPIGGQNP